MIKNFKILSMLVIVFSLIVIIYQFYPQDVIDVSIAEPDEIKIPTSIGSISQSAFNDFPLNHQRIIEFEVDEDTFSRLTNREQMDQLRDWLLFTVIYASGLSVEDINKCLYDLPAIRYGYTFPVANFEFGTTRSVYIGDGKVIALIPSTSSEDTVDLISNISDKHRKDVGEIPKILKVFEYEIVPSKQYAKVTRRKIIDGHDLFTESNGYFETAIVNLDDLENFMKNIDDITYAKIDGYKLILGGRSLRRYYRNIRVEDIAAIWQSEDKIHHKLKQFNNKWDKVTYRSEWEKNQLIKELLEERRKLKIVQGSGFSLDPQYDYEKLAEYLKKIEPNLSSLVLLGSKVKKSDIDRAINGINNRDETLLLELIQKFLNGNVLDKQYGDSLYHSILFTDKFQFQAARYDGELKGTEVGMVLFYTDLMAKIWGVVNYFNSAPENKIEGFLSSPNVKLSAIYQQESDEFPVIRLWFGPLNNGFQITQREKSIIMARNATRVYSAGSNPLQPGKETLASAFFAATIDWWNDHYEEIANYEQEYERLNEIMKWSLLIGWLNEKAYANLLGFLKDVYVERSNWFPDWARKKESLKYNDWMDVNFYPRGYKGTETEAMPILISPLFNFFGIENYTLGGVSLAEKSLFRARTALSQNFNKVLSRSNLDFKLTKSGASRLTTFEGVKYDLNKLSIGKSSVKTFAKEGTKLRGSHSELINMPFERIVSREQTGITFSTRLGDNPLGNLKIDRTSNGFKAGWQSRNIDAGQSLGRRLSKTKPADRSKILSEDPNVESFLVSDKGEFIVKMNDENRWMKIASESRPSANIPKGWQSRVSDYNGGKDNILLAWLEKDAAKGTLSQEGYIVAEPIKGGSKNIWRNSPTRGPPDRAKLTDIKYGDKTIKAQLDSQSGELYIAKSELAKVTDNDILNFQQIVHNADIAKIRNLAKTSHSKIQYAIPESRMGGGNKFYQNIRNRNFGDMAKQISTNPKNIRRYIDGYLKSELERSMELLKINKPYKALRIYDELIDMYGPLPELTLRKGAILIEKGNTRSVINTLQNTINRPLRNRTQFFDEINNRIQIASSRKANDLYNYAKRVDWLDIHTRGNFLNGKVKPVNIKSNFTLEYQLNELPKASYVNPKKVEQFFGKKTAIYVEDSPGFNNLDWSPSTAHKTIESIISGDLGYVVKLPRGDIRFFNPVKIYSPEGKTFYNSITKSKISTLTKTTSSHPVKYRPYNLDRCPWADDCDDGEKESAVEINLNRDNVEDSVFLIVASKSD